jgi:hypothetical protein
LYNTGYPEETNQTCNEEKHFPVADFSFSKMAFGKYNTDYQENGKPQQLEKLKSGNIIYKPYFFQNEVK